MDSDVRPPASRAAAERECDAGSRVFAHVCSHAYPLFIAARRIAARAVAISTSRAVREIGCSRSHTLKVPRASAWR